MPKRRRSLRCPTCKKLVVRSGPDYPFCSERCRLIDLGKWASGGYVIAAPVNEADQFGDAPSVPPRPAAKPDGSAQPHDTRGKRS